MINDYISNRLGILLMCRIILEGCKGKLVCKA